MLFNKLYYVPDWKSTMYEKNTKISFDKHLAQICNKTNQK